MQLRIFLPARLSFRFDREIKSFTDKQKLRDFSTIKPALQQMLKKTNKQTKKKPFSKQELQEKEKTYTK